MLSELGLEKERPETDLVAMLESVTGTSGPA